MKKILDDVCQLLHKRKYKEAERLLIKYVEETLTKSADSNHLNYRKEIWLTIYRSFNDYYLCWLKRNKIDIKKEQELFKSCIHTNYLIAKSSKVPEMDDLLFEVGNYLNNLSSKEQKREAMYHLHCYKSSQGKLDGIKVN